MLFAVQLSLKLGTILFFVGSVASDCGGSKPIPLCCMEIAPFYTNAYVWGGICGYQPSSQDELIGSRCIPNPGTCPSGTISTCCLGEIPGQCDLGTNCGTPFTSSPPIVPAPIPTRWVSDFFCSSDNGLRVLANAVVNQLPSTNTPSACISLCSSQGYLYAGIEYGKGCICGTGYKTSPAPSAIDSSNCNMRCTGSDQYTCGGAYAIQLYHGSSPDDVFPPGWTPAFACAVDGPNRVLTNSILTHPSVNSPGICSSYCAQQAYAFAGVEYGSECHCGTSIVPATADAPVSDCSEPCTGNLGLTCGGPFRIQIYTST